MSCAAEQLYNQIELDELLRFIDFDKVTKNIEFPDDHAATRDVHFPLVEGLPEKKDFIGRIFAMSKNRAIVPHGHRNMVSGHLIIKGKMHVRHFERIKDESDYLLIKPTIDRVSDQGHITTISDEKDNVHWIKALTETAFTFDIIVADLDPQYPTRIDNIDPDNGEKLSGGLIRAKIIDVKEAFRIYGKS
jgi:hypothetical protein